MTASPAFAPDSRLVAAVRPSPNHGERQGGARPDALVLHYTGMADGPSALRRLCDPAAEVSSHYLVEEDGAVLQLVPEARRAWHAGREPWAGRHDLNSASIGIEVVNGGHDFGLPPFPEAQVAALEALCRDILQRCGIAPARVLAHSDIAPSRKQDPGERFPWARLAAAGIGLWVPPSLDAAPADALSAEAVVALQSDLARFGYGIAPTGTHDAASRDVVAAFQRRHRPARVDGALDPGTRDTLARLMALRFGAGPEAAPARA
ncbi:N-acetylmuramoyl-L-alanine amidase [Lichenibacterium ramalinae]|uniref:N-acetylmuramoyl-L-alanine amidase n=1 Tax=Lichenibacterium ramalinae TaxID=2316527 RepID=UPI001FDF8D1D|nr:N-acetylmuramoyl-L-alanine amidase [Lichenibacterium ramalinae]